VCKKKYTWRNIGAVSAVENLKFWVCSVFGNITVKAFLPDIRISI
jgi:hypothetical protein